MRRYREQEWKGDKGYAGQERAGARGGVARGNVRVVHEHLVHRRPREIDEGDQGGGLAAPRHTAEDAWVAALKALVEGRRHVAVQSEHVDLRAQEVEVLRREHLDLVLDAAGHMEPRVVADATDGLAQLKLLVARGQVARSLALCLDDVEDWVRHCETKGEESEDSAHPFDGARAPMQSAWQRGPWVMSGAHCQAEDRDGKGSRRRTA